MAIKRVISLRMIGLMRSRRYPSITICPASVPVTVELCPDAINAIAKRVEATVDPSMGDNNSCACFISAYICFACLKKNCCSQYQYGGIDKKSNVECNGTVNKTKLQCLPDSLVCFF